MPHAESHASEMDSHINLISKQQLLWCEEVLYVEDQRIGYKIWQCQPNENRQWRTSDTDSLHLTTVSRLRISIVK